MEKGNKIVRRLTNESFVLVRPKQFGDADRTARAMALCKGVNKVFLTSGEYGFIVSTKENSVMVNNLILKQLEKSKAKIATGHFVYVNKSI